MANKSLPFLPYGCHSITEADVEAVIQALRSGTLTGGREVAALEEELAQECGVRHAVACSSGTAALHLGCLAAGLRPGERIVTSAITFLASASCGSLCGAGADFADIHFETGLVDPGSMASRIGPDTRIVIPVDYAGSVADLSGIAGQVDRARVFILEDACHALGADDGTAPAASCAIADAATLSFHPVKAIAAGEGGALLTNSETLADEARRLRSHGVERDPGRFRRDERGPWVYEMQSLGLNYRMPEINAALARTQLKRLRAMVARRREIASKFDAAFGSLPGVQPLREPPGVRSARHIYVLLIDFGFRGTTRERAMEYLGRRGIGTQVHYIPVFLHPYYRSHCPDGPARCPGAMEFYRKCLTIPLYPAMTNSDADRVINAVGEALDPER